MRFRCGSCKLKFVVILSFFAMFKNVVHNLEPGEMPRYSASHQALNYVQPVLNNAKYYKTVQCGCGAVAFIFSIYLKPEL